MDRKEPDDISEHEADADKVMKENKQGSILTDHDNLSTIFSTTEENNKAGSTQTSNQANVESGCPANLKEEYSQNVATASLTHGMHGLLPSNDFVRDIHSQIMRNYHTIATEGDMDPDDFYYHDKSTKLCAIPPNPYRANNNVHVALKVILKSDYLTSDLSKKVNEHIDKVSWWGKSEEVSKVW